jgi:hypothetical protein
MGINDFFTSVVPLLKQRDEPIKILLEEGDKAEVFNEKMYDIINTLEVNNSIDFINSNVPSKLDFFEELINLYCKQVYQSSLGEVDVFSNNVDGFQSKIKKDNILSFDGTKLNVYSFGNSNKDSIIIILPTGMPMLIMKSWIEKLMLDYNVITWETRGMFSEFNEIDNNQKLDVSSQIKDLKSIFAFYSIHKIHIFGVCQGVNLALEACKEFKDIVISSSMWHGDYNWRDKNKLTFVQTNFMQMMEIAKGLDDVSSLRSIMCSPKSLKKLLNDYTIEMLPNVMYPYISDRIFSNFIKLSNNLLALDLSINIDKIEQRVLIVTSNDDQTAHPEGSKELNTILENSELYVRSKGSHISFFDAPNELVNVFYDFFIKNQDFNLNTIIL